MGKLTPVRGLCLARALPSCPSPAALDIGPESQAAGTQSLVMFVCFMCQCMFFSVASAASAVIDLRTAATAQQRSASCPAEPPASLPFLPRCAAPMPTPHLLSPCPIPTPCSLMSTLLCPWLTPRDPRIRWGGGKTSVAVGAACVPKFSLASSFFFRKRTHSPSSKDEQSIGLKDSLLAHSSDPVEMRRLNYQTPGKADPSASWPPAQS